MQTQALIAHERQVVLELVHTLFWAIDARQWHRVASACAPSLAADWDGLTGAPFSDAVRQCYAGMVTHHQCTNAVIAVQGDTAQLSMLVTARHRRPTMRGADYFTRWSTDDVAMRRSTEGWQVTGLKRTPRMADGNPGVLAGGGLPEPAASTAPLQPEPPVRGEAERLARLADHHAIEDLMMRFGRGLDAKDWTLYRSCFAERVVVDFRATTGRAAKCVPADGFVTFAAMRQRGHQAFHQYSNFQVSVDGDRARCILYMAAHHRAVSDTGDPLNVFYGWYDNEFVRTSDGWRLSKLSHPLQWVSGNAAIKDAPDAEAEALGRALFGSAEAL